MKKVKRIAEDLTRRVKYDALGFHKNLLIVGKETGPAQRLVDSLDDSFNIFSAYTSGFKESNDIYYHRPYDGGAFDEDKELQTVSEEFTDKKVQFEAILLTNKISDNNTNSIESERFFDTANLRHLYHSVSKDLIAFKLAQKHLKPKGAVISVYNLNEFATEHKSTFDNVTAMAKMHLKFLLSELEYLNYENRFYTILLDAEDSLQDKDKYHKEVNKLIEKSVFNRTSMPHNSYVHVKQEEGGKINYYYK